MACINPDGVAGEIIYNSHFKTMLFCNGTDWVDMGSGGAVQGTLTGTGGGGKFVDGTNTNDAVYTGGNVGIGTATPTESLHVDGTVLGNRLRVGQAVTGIPAPSGYQANWKVADNAAGCDADTDGTLKYASSVLQICINGTGWVDVGSAASGTAGQWTQNGSDVGYTAGNVGIGTTAPGEKLHVENGNIVINNDDDDSYIFLHDPGHTGWYLGQDRSDAGAFKISTFNTTTFADTRFTIDYTGNVGIGTTSPTATLEVDAPITNGQLRLGQLQFKNSSGSYTKPTDGIHIFPFSDGNLYTDNFDGGFMWRTGASIERMRITSSGNVGIGTTSPVMRMDVSGGVNITYGSIYDVWIQGGGAGAGEERNLALLGTRDGNGDYLWVNYNSEYQGGTYIGGPIYMQNVSNVAYNYPLCINSGSNWIGYAGSCALSDRRAKTGLVELDNVLDKIDALSGYRFDWSDEERKERDGRQIGLVAQDVDVHFPEAIIRNRGDGMLGLNYDSLVAVAIEGIKELRAETRDEMQILRDENAALKARIEVLEQAIATQ